MKKALAPLLALVIALTVLVRCCDEETPKSAKDKVYNAAYLVNGNLGDKPFFDSAEAGFKELPAAGRITLNAIRTCSIEEDLAGWTEYKLDDSENYASSSAIPTRCPITRKNLPPLIPSRNFIIFDDNTYVGTNENVMNHRTHVRI